MTELKVGAETQAYCTSCRTMRDHVIVAMVEARPAKVECDVCHKQHLYKAAPPGSRSGAKTGARARRAAEPEKAAAPSIDIEALTAGREARAYHPGTTFALGDVVRHPTFGVGLVTALPGAQKAEVTFPVGPKLLAHDRNAAAAGPSLTRPVRRDEDDRRLPSDAPPRPSPR